MISGNAFGQGQLQAAADRHASLPPQEFFSRVLEEIREFSQRQSFEDDVCVVGIQPQHSMNGK